ncbi:hypothetical protein BBO99_00005512 [Phytophthora kernoviae]|uniref:Ubiquitin carboxyl-terminal hydrolase n=2 Tax=Phytophthora kernoviae TaxID=325452 RepID=A0A3R7NFE0_9STRA|nr:hypothetical protein G195_006213 [Phytophthora kernoviae 00238/432]KAG2523437.1 hypothetical protein JM16_005328 [Phytophthora kernoviae]KAG2525307.1 hypothetical protein JM18_004760 [Phytophthora kernoviae]RLN37262.1 hypothetical protein BBI17_005601 [Phytophthora kernoviae]RLN79105.1 hypothetical protein BBO99_00005512 [Phytophthora kernoviae]
MAIIRFGTCGSVRDQVTPGSVVVSGKGSVMVTRNPDAFFSDVSGEDCYKVSRVMPASPALSKTLVSAMESQLDELRNEPIVAANTDRELIGVYDGLNATSCSFYSSQGRLDSAFDDRNEQLVENLTKTHPELHTLEMETFHLLDLAQRSRGSIQATAAVLVVANRITGQVVDSLFFSESIKKIKIMSDDESKPKRWFPLESNPDVMNNYVEKMGFPTDQFSFCDVLSTEEWALGMVPSPVVAVIMLFPIKPHTEEAAKQEAVRIEREGQTVSPNVYYMRQTVGNACGTVGILHAIGNMRHLVQLTPGSYLDKFFNKTKTKTPKEIAQYLEEDDEVRHYLEETHGSAAEAGQSEQLETVDDPINTHFVCFSHVDGHLYELDGRKKHPINHGPSSPTTVLPDACAEIKKFMARDEGEMRFTILALAKTAAD